MEVTPDQTILGSVEINEIQARLITKHAKEILEGTLEQAVKSYVAIFNELPPDAMAMEIFKAFCVHVVEGNELKGRKLEWSDIDKWRERLENQFREVNDNNNGQ